MRARADALSGEQYLCRNRNVIQIFKPGLTKVRPGFLFYSSLKYWEALPHRVCKTRLRYQNSGWSGVQRFNSFVSHKCSVRQLAKSPPFQGGVEGSIPSRNTKLLRYANWNKRPDFQSGHRKMCAGSSPVRSTKMGVIQHRQLSRSVKPVPSGVVGSSPSTPTKK